MARPPQPRGGRTIEIPKQESAFKPIDGEAAMISHFIPDIKNALSTEQFSQYRRPIVLQYDQNAQARDYFPVYQVYRELCSFGFLKSDVEYAVGLVFGPDALGIERLAVAEAKIDEKPLTRTPTIEQLSKAREAVIQQLVTTLPMTNIPISFGGSLVPSPDSTDPKEMNAREFRKQAATEAATTVSDASATSSTQVVTLLSDRGCPKEIAQSVVDQCLKDEVKPSALLESAVILAARTLCRLTFTRLQNSEGFIPPNKRPQPRDILRCVGETKEVVDQEYQTAKEKLASQRCALGADSALGRHTPKLSRTDGERVVAGVSYVHWTAEIGYQSLTENEAATVKYSSSIPAQSWPVVSGPLCYTDPDEASLRQKLFGNKRRPPRFGPLPREKFQGPVPTWITVDIYIPVGGVGMKVFYPVAFPLIIPRANEQVKRYEMSIVFRRLIEHTISYAFDPACQYSYAFCELPVTGILNAFQRSFGDEMTDARADWRAHRFDSSQDPWLERDWVNCVRRAQLDIAQLETDEKDQVAALIPTQETTQQSREADRRFRIQQALEPSALSPAGQHRLKCEYERRLKQTQASVAQTPRIEPAKPQQQLFQGRKTSPKAVLELYQKCLTNDTRRQLAAFRDTLPASKNADKLIEAMDTHQVVVLSGETGSGKTTQLPARVLEAALSKGDGSIRVICTQPRRVAAISVATRVAEEIGSKLGDLVGYSVRGDRAVGANTALLFCTTGVLLRQLMSASVFDGGEFPFTHVFIDEIHENGLFEEFLLGIFRQFIVKGVKVPKLCLMSATLAASTFQTFFARALSARDGGVTEISVQQAAQMVPLLEVPGRVFPVDVHYIEDVIRLTRFELFEGSEFCAPTTGPDAAAARSALLRQPKDLAETVGAHQTAFKSLGAHTQTVREAFDDINWLNRVRAVFPDIDEETLFTLSRIDLTSICYPLIVAAVEYAISAGHAGPRKGEQSGAILVFLPGWAEIQRCIQFLEEESSPQTRKKLVCLPLHSQVSPAEQRAVFRPPPAGKIKVVVSTNIAETSVTIPDVTVVIDTGFLREVRYNPKKGVAGRSLELVQVSQSAAVQRSGRAGRVRPGVCFRLYTRGGLMCQPDRPDPEICRTPLADTVLMALGLGIASPVSFLLNDCPTPPTVQGVSSAVGLLANIGAVTQVSEATAESPGEVILTPLGSVLAAVPAELTCGLLCVLGAAFGCLDEALTLAAAMSARQLPVMPSCTYAKSNGSTHIAALITSQAYFRAVASGQAASWLKRTDIPRLVMMEVTDARQQFVEALIATGLLPSNYPATPLNDQANMQSYIVRNQSNGDILKAVQFYNRNMGKRKLIRALVSAALWPAVAKLQMTDRQRRDGGFFYNLNLPSGASVAFHPTTEMSDLALHKRLSHTYYSFGSALTTTQTFISDITAISPMSLTLLAAGRFRAPLMLSCVGLDAFGLTISLANPPWLAFKVSVVDAIYIKLLRQVCEDYKKRFVGATKSSESPLDVAVQFRAITDIVSAILESENQI